MHTSQTDFSKFVFLTHWKPHSSEKIHLTCSSPLSRNVSRDGCVNTAKLSKPPSRWGGVIRQGKKLNPDPGVRGTANSSKGGWACNWTRHFPDYTVVTDPSKGHRCISCSQMGPYCVLSCRRSCSWSTGCGYGEGR